MQKDCKICYACGEDHKYDYQEAVEKHRQLLLKASLFEILKKIYNYRLQIDWQAYLCFLAVSSFILGYFYLMFSLFTTRG